MAVIATDPLAERAAAGADLQAASPGGPRAVYLTLDAWRGIAALAVVLFHAAEKVVDRDASARHDPLYAACYHGDLGVQIFFVISGFCIANAACATLSQGRSVGSYALARVRRIFPPMWISLIFFAAFYAAGQILMNRGLLSTNFSRVMPLNIFKMRIGFWIANLTLTQPLVHRLFLSSVCWTLCYEVAFYAIMGAFILARYAGGGTRALLNLAHILTAGLLLLLCLDPAIVSYPWDMWPQFGLGVVVYDLVAHRNVRGTKIFAAVIALEAMCFVRFSDKALGFATMAQPGRLAYLVTLAFAAGLVFLHGFDAALSRRLAIRLLSSVGKVSYTLYLTHFLALMALHLLFRMARLEDWVHFRFAISIPISLAVAYALYPFMERPFLRVRMKKTPNQPPKIDGVEAAQLMSAP